MKYLRYEELFDPELLKRPDQDLSEVSSAVDEILSAVKERGDEAIREYEARFDGSDLSSLYVTEEEFESAEKELPESLKKAIIEAHKNIEAFHKSELPAGESVETAKGVLCWRRIVPIEKVGLYIPGGTAPLFSTVLMLATPALIAGCKDIILATPAKNNRVNPAILFAASVAGIKKIVKVGGAQAIAAFAYGTESISKRDKIFGPGNRFVSCAKLKVSSFVAIDMLAGPSEVMVVADKEANPLFVASDLLSQAEHGKDSQVVLLIKSKDKEEAREIYERVEEELEKEINKLNRKEYMLPSLSHSVAFSFCDNDSLIAAINLYAPEHLIINTADADDILSGVVNAGSVFLGQYTPESAGDYASGTNHTLPTSGWAKSTAGVSVDSFIKKMTVQRITKEGIRELAPVIMELAGAEGLTAHREAAEVRIENN